MTPKWMHLRNFYCLFIVPTFFSVLVFFCEPSRSSGCGICPKVNQLRRIYYHSSSLGGVVGVRLNCWRRAKHAAPTGGIIFVGVCRRPRTPKLSMRGPVVRTSQSHQCSPPASERATKRDERLTACNHQRSPWLRCFAQSTM